MRKRKKKKRRREGKGKDPDFHLYLLGIIHMSSDDFLLEVCVCVCVCSSLKMEHICFLSNQLPVIQKEKEKYKL